MHDAGRRIGIAWSTVAIGAVTGSLISVHCLAAEIDIV